MAKYYGTYSCGHEGKTDVTGPTKNRQWLADRHFEGLCCECWKRKLEEERASALTSAQEKALEMELTELTGTEKQIEWAVRLRQTMIDHFDKFIERYEDKQLAAAFLDYLLKKTAARFYIDNREDIEDSHYGVHSLIKKYREEFEQAEASPPVEKEKIILYPENQTYSIPAKVYISGTAINAFYQKNETFRSIVKDFGCYWNDRSWERQISFVSGLIEDRAAELVNKLLRNGFAVEVEDEKIKQKALTADFEPECKNWIMLIKGGYYSGNLSIKWDGWNDEYYKMAKKIASAEWSRERRYMAVKIEACQEVLDFANMLGFKITPAAQAAIDSYKEKIANAERVTPDKSRQYKAKDGLMEILKSEGGIDDLKD